MIKISGYKACKLATHSQKLNDWKSEWYLENERCESCDKITKISTDTYDGDRDYLCKKCYLLVNLIFYNDCKGCDNCYREGDE